MSITVPTDGDPVIASWGNDVATQLNHMIPVIMSADFPLTSVSFPTVGDITGLTFTCVSGKVYNIQLCGTYTVGGTSTGLGLGYNHPGGTARLLSEILSSSTSDSTPDTEWLIATDTATGTSTTDTTNSHFWSLRGIYQCTSDGTFAVRANRNGTSTTVTLIKGSGGLVIQS